MISKLLARRYEGGQWRKITTPKHISVHFCMYFMYVLVLSVSVIKNNNNNMLLQSLYYRFTAA